MLNLRSLFKFVFIIFYSNQTYVIKHNNTTLFTRSPIDSWTWAPIPHKDGPDLKASKMCPNHPENSLERH